MVTKYLGSTMEFFLVSHAKDSSNEQFKTKRTMFAFMEPNVLFQLLQERNVQHAGDIDHIYNLHYFPNLLKYKLIMIDFLQI